MPEWKFPTQEKKECNKNALKVNTQCFFTEFFFVCKIDLEVSNCIGVF